MIYIFRLSRLTGTEATFTIGREITFTKLIYRGFVAENVDITSFAKGDFAEGIALPVYAECDFLTDANLILNNGNLTTEDGPQNMIPLSGLDGWSSSLEGQLTLISHPTPTTWAAGKTVTIALFESDNAGTLSALPVAAAFGAALITEGGSNFVHVGINLYFEFVTDQRFDNTSTGATIADAT